MKYKHILLLLSGCLLATCLSIICASQFIVDKIIPSKNVEENYTYKRACISSVYTTNQVDVNISMVDKYNKLDFSSIEDLLTSLYSLTNIDNISPLYEERLYDFSEDDIVSVYHSSDNKISVVVLPNGEISSCTFEGISKDDEALVKKYSEGSNYRFKIVNDGFILEKDVVMV